MKLNLKLLIFCVTLPLLVGISSSYFTIDTIKLFDELKQPFFAPPAWAFSVVWPALYILMGVSHYLIVVAKKDKKEKKLAYKIYYTQLAFNFLWSILFFNYQLLSFTVVWIFILWVLIILNMIANYRFSKLAMILLIPYLAWVTFAGFLNLAIALLN